MRSKKFKKLLKNKLNTYKDLKKMAANLPGKTNMLRCGFIVMRIVDSDLIFTK